jgi:hypothetical protein
LLLHRYQGYPISMSRLLCYYAFVKVTNDIGIQDKKIADEDWAHHHIQNQDGLKDCDVSHMNRSISSKCQSTNNRYISPENKETILRNKKMIVTVKSNSTKTFIHFYYVLFSATTISIPTILCDTKSWQGIWDNPSRSCLLSLKCHDDLFQAVNKATSQKHLMSLQIKRKGQCHLTPLSLPRCSKMLS